MQRNAVRIATVSYTGPRTPIDASPLAGDYTWLDFNGTTFANESQGAGAATSYLLPANPSEVAEAQRDPQLGEAWRDRVVEQLRSRHRIMLNRAVARGEIPASTDQEVVLGLIFGAAYHRMLHGHQPLTDAFVRKVVDVVVAGIQRA